MFILNDSTKRSRSLMPRISLLVMVLSTLLSSLLVSTHAALVAHWRFDEASGTVAHDVTGRYDGELSTTGAWFVSGGVAGNALRLDRTEKGVALMPHLPELVTNDFSVVAWARLSAGDTTPTTFLLSQHEAWYENGFFLMMNQHLGGGEPSKATFMVNDITHLVRSTSAINDGQWHQLIGVYRKSGDMEIYVDGSPAEASMAGPKIQNRLAPFIIGGLLGNEVTGHVDAYYTGWVDDVQVYDQPLSNEQIDLLFGNPGKNLLEFEPALVISPNGGEFLRPVEVSLTSSVVGASIRYTLDGSEPSASSSLYVTPVTLRQTTTVKAQLFVGTFPASKIVSATFTILPDIVFLPAGGLFTNSVEVTILNNLGLGSITYTLDGSDPNEASTVYSSPIMLRAAAIIKARIVFNDFPVSDILTATFARVYAIDDGIPNTWREEYFGPGYLTDPRVGSLEDPDHDGANNLQEYTAGSDPLDPLSGFAVGIQFVPLISWVSVPDQVYSIQRKTSLEDTTWTVIVPEFKATSTNSAYVDIEVAGQRAFYTITVQD